jgi:hypothetical protein
MAQGDDRFAELSKAAAQSVSRRQALRLAVGGLAGAAFAGVGLGNASAAPNRCAQFCASEPPGPRRAACKQACKQCGGDVSRICFGAEIICCPPDTTCCESSTAMFCCPAGTRCADGECVEVVTCPGGQPAENCELGISTNCPENEACALVDDADGDGCHCIERLCGAPCTTDADCTDGTVCISAPGCCPDTTFCGTPCGSGATGLATTRSWGQ